MLACINLLPIPGLDGGQLFFLAYEAIRGKPLLSLHKFCDTHRHYCNRVTRDSRHTPRSSKNPGVNLPVQQAPTS